MSDEERTGRSPHNYGGLRTDRNPEVSSEEPLEPGMLQDMQDTVSFDPERGAGTTSDPKKAAEEGLSYQPPQDPPIASSEHPRGAVCE